MQTMAIVFFFGFASFLAGQEQSVREFFLLFLAIYPPFFLSVFWLLMATGLRGKVKTTHELMGGGESITYLLTAHELFKLYYR